MKIQSLIYLSILFILCCKTPDDTEMPTPDPVRISIEDNFILEGDEGNSSIEFTIELTEASAQTISVDYTTEDLSAMVYLDYIPISGQLSFAPGETTKTLTVETITDEWREGNEKFNVKLSNPTNAEIFGGTAIGTIRNDDTNLDKAEDGYITRTSYEGFESVWVDEFDGPEIDLDNWTFEIGNGQEGWGNNELEYYTDRPENASIQDGNLVIHATNVPWVGRQYTSARMITRDKKEFKFGRIDIRAKIPKTQGIWPALWMLGANFGEIGWPQCGEIDIMELVGHFPSIVHGTIHYGDDFPNNSFKGESFSIAPNTFDEEFHVFTLLWDLNRIAWYVDDIVYYEIDPTTLDGKPYPFNQDFFFLFNVAIGGNWPGNPDQTTEFPQEMIVDYIRVFQKN